MTGFHSRFLLVVALILGIAATARAEAIFSVNVAGAGNWVFDQPSVVANGTVIHVAFVGDNTAGPATTNTRPAAVARAALRSISRLLLGVVTSTLLQRS